MARTRAVRGLAFAVMLVVTGSGLARGSCFMPGLREAGLRDAHACCKRGWTSRPPECCMAGGAGESPACLSAAAPTLGPAPAVAAGKDPSIAVDGDAVLPPNDRSHSPPVRAALRM